jgi:hypothetical protein
LRNDPRIEAGGCGDLGRQWDYRSGGRQRRKWNCRCMCCSYRRQTPRRRCRRGVAWRGGAGRDGAGRDGAGTRSYRGSSARAGGVAAGDGGVVCGGCRGAFCAETSARSDSSADESRVDSNCKRDCPRSSSAAFADVQLSAVSSVGRRQFE